MSFFSCYYRKKCKTRIYCESKLQKKKCLCEYQLSIWNQCFVVKQWFIIEKQYWWMFPNWFRIHVCHIHNGKFSSFFDDNRQICEKMMNHRYLHYHFDHLLSTKIFDVIHFNNDFKFFMKEINLTLWQNNTPITTWKIK